MTQYSDGAVTDYNDGALTEYNDREVNITIKQ